MGKMLLTGYTSFSY